MKGAVWFERSYIRSLGLEARIFMKTFAVISYFFAFYELLFYGGGGALLYIFLREVRLTQLLWEARIGTVIVYPFKNIYNFTIFQKLKNGFRLGF